MLSAHTNTLADTQTLIQDQSLNLQFYFSLGFFHHTLPESWSFQMLIDHRV